LKRFLWYLPVFLHLWYFQFTRWYLWTSQHRWFPDGILPFSHHTSLPVRSSPDLRWYKLFLIITRKVLNLENYITIYHIDMMNRIILITGSIVGVAYITEFFIAWYSGVEYEQYAFINRATGPYWWAYWSMMTCNVITPQLFWSAKLRTSLFATFFISIFVNIGMWFERFVIIVTSLHRDYVPSSWTMYSPTWVEVGIFIGSLGLFFVPFLLFTRFFPVIAMSELKTIVKSSSSQAKKKGAHHHEH
jgi:Ni/Fe-hydrogenase subunit HybB-like protein